MRFLLRMAFWLGVVLVLLPSGGSQPAPKINVSAGRRVLGGQGRRLRHAAILRAAARCLRGRIAGRRCDRPSGAGRRQDALRVPQRAGRSERDRSTPSVAGKAVPMPLRQAVAAHAAPAGRSRRLARPAHRTRGAADRPKRRRGVKSQHARACWALATAAQSPLYRGRIFSAMREHDRAPNTMTRSTRSSTTFRCSTSGTTAIAMSSSLAARLRRSPSATAATPTRCRAARARSGSRPRCVRTARPVRCCSFSGDSDAHIVRGLIAILFALYSGKHARDILATDASSCSNGSGCASISRRSARTVSARWSSASSRTRAPRWRRRPPASHSPTDERRIVGAAMFAPARARAARLGAIAIMAREPIETELQHHLGRTRRPTAFALDVLKAFEEAAYVEQESGEFRTDRSSA